MIKINRLAFATFESSDPNQLADYYADVMGLTKAPGDRGATSLASPLGETCIMIESGSQTRCTSIAFESSPLVDLDESARSLTSHGIAFEKRTDPYADVPATLRFADQKGTAIELFNAAPKRIDTEPNVGVSPLKLGHIAFNVPDVQKAVQFYTEVLGFRVSDWMSDFFVFLRCGPDHHTCNFLTGAQEKMHHIAFELKDWAHVQSACDVLARNDIKLTWGPGRHGIGHNIFTYHRNPQNQIIELFTQLDTMSNEEAGYFDPRPWHRDRPQRPKVWTPQDAVNMWGEGPPAGHRD